MGKFLKDELHRLNYTISSFLLMLSIKILFPSYLCCSDSNENLTCYFRSFSVAFIVQLLASVLTLLECTKPSNTFSLFLRWYFQHFLQLLLMFNSDFHIRINFCYIFYHCYASRTLVHFYKYAVVILFVKVSMTGHKTSIYIISRQLMFHSITFFYLHVIIPCFWLET